LAGGAFEGEGAAWAFFFPLVGQWVGAVRAGMAEVGETIETDMAEIRAWSAGGETGSRASRELKRATRAASATERPSSIAVDILSRGGQEWRSA